MQAENERTNENQRNTSSGVRVEITHREKETFRTVPSVSSSKIERQENLWREHRLETKAAR
jgi:hypothetical protein